MLLLGNTIINYPRHKCWVLRIYFFKHKIIHRVDNKILLSRSIETLSSKYLDQSSPYTTFTVTFLRRKNQIASVQEEYRHFRPF